MLSLLMAAIILSDTVFGALAQNDVRRLNQFVTCPSEPFPSQKTIYLFQDVHLNEEAQRDIASAVDLLIEAHPNKTISIGIEGGQGPYSYVDFQRLPRQNAVHKIADQLLHEGRISALAYWGLNGKHHGERKLRCYGLEDPILYQANVEAFRAAQPYQALLRLRLQDWQRHIAQRANQLPSKTRRFFQLSSRYHRGDIRLDLYVEQLRGWVAPTELPNSVIQYLQVLKMERSASAVFFHDYARYRTLISGINPIEISQAVVQLEDLIQVHLALNTRESRLFEDEKFVRLLQKLNNFSLTPTEWSEYQRARLAHVSWIKQNSAVILFEQFYRTAEKRNDAFIRNLKQADCMCLIAGGFHTSGLREAFRKKGIQTVVFTPRLTKINPKQISVSLNSFLKRKSSLFDLFRGNRLMMAPPEILGSVNPLKIGDPNRDDVEDRFEQLYSSLTGLRVTVKHKIPSTLSWLWKYFFPRESAETHIVKRAWWESQLLFTVSGTNAIMAGLQHASLTGAVIPALALGFLSGMSHIFGTYRKNAEGIWEEQKGLLSLRTSFSKAVGASWAQLIYALLLYGFTYFVSRSEVGRGPELVAAAVVIASISSLIPAQIHRLRNISSIQPFSTLGQIRDHISFLFRRSHRIAGLSVAVDILDVGAEVFDTTIATRFNFFRCMELMPLFAFLSFSDVYLYGGLYKMSKLSPKIHTVPNEDPHLLSSLPDSAQGTTDPNALPDHFAYVYVKNYDTKKDVLESENLVIRNTYPNAFSVIDLTQKNPWLGLGQLVFDYPWLEKLSSTIAAVKFRILVLWARILGLGITTDFFIWLAPDAITQHNYKWTFYHELSDLYEADEGIDWQQRWEEVKNQPSRYNHFVQELYAEYENYSSQRHYRIARLDYAVIFIREAIRAGEPPVLRPILVRHLEGMNKDQILPNIFNPDVQSYIRRILAQQTRDGVSRLRLDLGHLLLRKSMLPQIIAHPRSFTVSNLDADPEPIISLLRQAKKNSGGRLDYVIETYGANIPDFQTMQDDDGRPLVQTYLKQFHDHFLERNYDGMRPLLDHALNHGRWLNFVDNFDEPSIRQLTGDGVGALETRQDLFRRLLFYALLGLPAAIDLRSLLDFVGQFFAIVGKNHPSVTAEEVRQWRTFPLWYLILRSPISNLLQEYRIRLHLTDRQDLNNENRVRYWSMTGRDPEGNWVIHVQDHGLMAAPSFLMEAPDAFFLDADAGDLPLPEKIRFLQSDCELVDRHNNSVQWEAVLDEAWGVPLIRITTPLTAGDNQFTLRVRAVPTPKLQRMSYGRSMLIWSHGSDQHLGITRWLWPKIRKLYQAA